MTSEPKLNFSDLKPVKFVGSQTLGLGTLPPVQLGLFSEKLRKNAPRDFNCSVFCPGKKCQYEGPGCWTKEEMAISGIFSHWITEDIVAMARPSTAVIKKHDIIEQFKENGIKSLINLQQRGEHGSCGVPLEKSGFAYDPQVFMENKVFYYNFDWKDYSSVSKTRLLDIVKVLTFALSEGRVAVHSHCGLGRAGVLLACYLIYTVRCKPNDAVQYVRSKRPNSVPTKGQVESVQGFAQFVVPMFIIYANVIPRDYRTCLNHFLRRQRFLLHGFESRLLKYIPKPLYMFCERLLNLLDKNRFEFLDPEDPNRFRLFFSAAYRLGPSFTAKLTKSQTNWTLAIEKKALKKMDDLMVNGILDDPQHLCAPPSPAGTTEGSRHRHQSAFSDSADSFSSPDDNNRLSFCDLMVVGSRTQPSDDDVINYHTTGDEENGVIGDLEYNDDLLHHPNSVPPVSSSSSVRAQKSNDTTKQNGVILNKEIIKNSAKTPNDDPDAPNLNDDICHEDDLDDPLADMNSEECNAIIDSVLQDNPLEEESSAKLRRKSSRQDINANKEGKGCSTIVEDADSPKTYSLMSIIEALLADHYTADEEFTKRLKKYQRSINNRSASWEKVAKETDPMILSALLWSWLDQLKEPVLNRNDLACIVIRSEKPLEILQKLDYATRFTTEYLVRFIVQLRPKSTVVRDDLLKRLLASLTHQCVGIRGTLRPLGQSWIKMRRGTARELMVFINKLYDLVLASEKNLES